MLLILIRDIKFVSTLFSNIEIGFFLMWNIKQWIVDLSNFCIWFYVWLE